MARLNSLPALGNPVTPRNVYPAAKQVIVPGDTTISITPDDATGKLVLTAPGVSGAAATAEWGGITGTLSSQTDLQTALNSAASTATWAGISSKPTFATVATTGAYSDLTGKPTLFSGAFADLTGKPTTLNGYGITDALSSAGGTISGDLAVTGNVTVGPAGISGGATPANINLGGTYSSVAGQHPKVTLFDDGAGGVYGSGVSNSSLDYIVPGSAAHTFWVGGAQVATLNGSGLTVHNDTSTALEMLALKTTLGSNAPKSLTWRDASNIVGKISITYDGAGHTYMSFGSLYNGGYTSTEVMRLTPTGLTLNGLVNATDDAAAAAAGVPVNGLYRNGSVLMIRVA